MSGAIDYLDGVILGIVQGATEFLPVSSSGHLVIVQNWLEVFPGNPAALAFDVVSHLGTLLAVALVFYRPVVRMLCSRTYAPRILGLAVVSTVTTAAIALPFKAHLEKMFGPPQVVGVAMIATGILLFMTEKRANPQKSWRQFHWIAAVLIGLAQAVAVIPGVSRSGATICTAMLLGLRRRWAAEFSFLIAAPAILGATILEVDKLADATRTHGQPIGPIVVGGITACAIGYFALKLLLHSVRRAHLHWFSYYVWIVGLLLLVGFL